MYFQSLPNQYKKISEHRWKIGLGIIFAVAFFLWFSRFTYQTPLTLEQTEDLINKSERLKRIDNLCANLPKPDDFRLVSKKISGNSRTISISHYYQSEIQFEKIKEFYSDWLIQHGWKLEYENTLDFNKGDSMIHINKTVWASARYIVYCAKESQ